MFQEHRGGPCDRDIAGRREQFHFLLKNFLLKKV